MRFGLKLLPAVLLATLAALLPETASAQTRVALHATQEEINIWKQRTTSGPYLDDWNRILQRASNFKSNPSGTWAGNTTSSCFSPSSNNPNRALSQDLRDAAFVYMVT